ncbi:tetratricopeptide repeat protein [Rhodovulum sulfidophilum]|uniref:Tetratricopeptide repeat protein n=1 Tax=Rhodovulum sulfidophilum TaxID=35806 RepID=A0ABS1RYW4_RHOSU|nr:hypothetical protein [Rhodovulum sulfidophilum]MBL3611246.1 hypothetical protein [Rhodovulum sulfidophilum]MCE8458879.1 hypothetical protein [Rhodovulum sulfidophilum]
MINPDQINILFYALGGSSNLGRNVATVLSLQLAQTGRQFPWPDNRESHDFNRTALVYDSAPLAPPTHEAAVAAASDLMATAQIVVWGATYRYGGAVLADLNVTLPMFTPAGTSCARSHLPCDFRQANFESWTIRTGGHSLSVGPPRRRFAVTALQLRPEIVDRFTSIEGLPIRASRSVNSRIIGRTGEDLLFIEFNPGLPGTPSLVISEGVRGYVTLPEITGGVSEYAALVGGIVRVFRGDWEWAEKSFYSVIENPASRTPAILDAHLYLGRVLIEQGRGAEALEILERAHGLARLNRRAVQYLVQGQLAVGGETGRARAQAVLAESLNLFATDDPWLIEAAEIFPELFH